MGYLTENRLDDLLDIPIALPSTELKMGDWVVVSTIKVVEPMRLSCRFLNLHVLSSTVDPADITANNKIYGNLGAVYLVLRKNYTAGTPGDSAGLDSIVATDIGIYARDVTTPVVVVDPGNYSWIVANNTQISKNSNDPIPSTTSIDFNVSCIGSVRVELDKA